MFFLAVTLVGWIEGDFVYRKLAHFSATCVVFYGDIIFICQKLKIWTLREVLRITVPNLVTICQKVADYDLTVFIMAAICHLGFLAVKRPILHHRTKFHKDR